MSNPAPPPTKARRRWRRCRTLRALYLIQLAAHQYPHILSETGGMNRCRHCRCTWTRACEGGCYWVDEDRDLCSTCIPKEQARVWKECVDTVAALDVSLPDTNPGYRAACLMVAGMWLGQAPELLIKVSGYPKGFVRDVVRRYKAAGIWKDGLVDADWLDQKKGGPAFWLDVSVGLGLMEKGGAK